MLVETGRLLLRPLVLGDLEEVLELHRQPAVVEFLGPTTRALARKRLEFCEQNWRERGHDLMAVLERSSGRFVGRIGLRYWPQFNETEAGWAMRREAWGRGYATEAARAAIDWGFQTLPVPYVTAMIRPDNSRSLGVARRLGFAPLRDDVLQEVPVIVHAVDRAGWGARAQPDDAEPVLEHIARWARTRSDLVAVALVGSRARNTPRPGSDIDLVFLSRDPAGYVRREDWAAELGAGAVLASAQRGVLTEHRLRLSCGLDLDVAVGSAQWASVYPVDPGTARVVRGGLRILYDPHKLLLNLKAAVA